MIFIQISININSNRSLYHNFIGELTLVKYLYGNFFSQLSHYLSGTGNFSIKALGGVGSFK